VANDEGGFETGSVDEIERAKTFIAERVKAIKLSEQLHAIWCGMNARSSVESSQVDFRYCLPTDTNRPVTRAEEDFFNAGVHGQGDPELLEDFLR
jgi:hypothetical protein